MWPRKQRIKHIENDEAKQLRDQSNDPGRIMAGDLGARIASRNVTEGLRTAADYNNVVSREFGW